MANEEFSQFQRQLIRLKRTGWTDKVDELAQEIYQILQQIPEPTVPNVQNSIPGADPLTQPPQPKNNLVVPDFIQNPTKPPDERPEVARNDNIVTETHTIWKREAHPAKITSHSGSGVYAGTLYPNSRDNTGYSGSLIEVGGDTGVAANTYVVANQISQVEQQDTYTVIEGKRVLQSTSFSLKNTWVYFQKGGGGGSTFPGKVVNASNVTGGTAGDGQTYTVDVYESGLTEAATRVTVRQLQLIAGEIIPDSTWAIVTKVGSNYYMQVPVWL